MSGARYWREAPFADRLAAVERMLAEHRSFDVIAAALDTTRGAIAGFVHRNGLSGTARPGRIVVPKAAGSTMHVLRRPKNDRSAAGGRTRSAQVHGGPVSLAGSGRDRQSAVGSGQSEEGIERVRRAPPKSGVDASAFFSTAHCPLPTAAGEAGIPFSALDALFERCRRPLWGGAPVPLDDKRWCGAPTVAGQSYCAGCHADLTAPPSERLRRQTGEAAAGAPKSGRVTA